jgi:hypothetical protein
MKKIVSLLIVVTITLQLSIAQNFNFPRTSAYFEALPTVNDFGGYITLTNTSNPKIDLEMKWERIENNLPSEWEASICDPEGCKTPLVDASVFTLPKEGDNHYINIHFYPYNTEGEGITKVKVYETADPDNFVVLTFTGKAQTPTSIEEFSTQSIGFYPNPAQDVIYFKSIPNKPVQIIDITGKIIFQENTFNKNAISLQNFNKGIYFLKIGTKTEKLIVH